MLLQGEELSGPAIYVPDGVGGDRRRKLHEIFGTLPLLFRVGPMFRRSAYYLGKDMVVEEIAASEYPYFKMVEVTDEELIFQIRHIAAGLKVGKL